MRTRGDSDSGRKANEGFGAGAKEVERPWIKSSFTYFRSDKNETMLK